MIRLTPVLAGTALVVTGAFGFEEFKHQDATLHSHQEQPEALVAVHELERQPGVEHSHVESGSSPDNQIDRAAMGENASRVSASFLVHYEQHGP